MNIKLNDTEANNIYLFLSSFKNQGLDFKLWYRFDKISSKLESTYKSVAALFAKIKQENPDITDGDLQIKITETCTSQSSEYAIDLIPFDLLADSGLKANFDTLKLIIAFPEEENAVKESDVQEANILE